MIFDPISDLELGIEAGSNVTITGNTISATGGGGGSYSAGTAISIANNMISVKVGDGLHVNEVNNLCIDALNACHPIPEDVRHQSQPEAIVNTVDMCNDLRTKGYAKEGMLYVGSVVLADNPPGVIAGEVTIKVMLEEYLFTLEMFSTEVAPYHWYAIFQGEGMITGGTITPWQAIPSCRYIGEDRETGIWAPVGIYDTATKKYVDDLNNKGQQFETLTASNNVVTISPVNKKIYKYTAAAGNSIKLNSGSNNECTTIELWITMPATLVTFSWDSSNNIWWDDGNSHFTSTSSTPLFNNPSTLYCVILRYDGSNWLGNIAYTKKVTA